MLIHTRPHKARQSGIAVLAIVAIIPLILLFVAFFSLYLFESEESRDEAEPEVADCPVPPAPHDPTEVVSKIATPKQLAELSEELDAFAAETPIVVPSTESFDEIYRQMRALRSRFAIAETEAEALLHANVPPPLLVVDGRVDITHAVTLDDLSNIETINGMMAIHSSALADIALPRLNQVSGDLRMTDLPALQTLTMPQLDYVGGSFVLSATSLPSTAGLGPLQSAAHITVANNAALVDLDAFEQLMAFSGEISATNNSQLCQSLLDAWIATLLGATQVTTGGNGAC